MQKNINECHQSKNLKISKQTKGNEDLITLYKYMGIYRTESNGEKINIVEEIIKHSRLFCSKAEDLNDPFELRIFDKKKNQFSINRDLRMLCLTNSCRKKLMWSYYANGHKGVCLTVQVPKEIVRPIFYTTKRIFSDTKLTDILSLKRLQNIKQNCISNYDDYDDELKIAFIKDSKWRDEFEYRAVFSMKHIKRFIDEGLCELDEGKLFVKVKITNIYLGVSCDDENKQKIIQICNSKGINVKQMTYGNNDYSIKAKAVYV